MAANNLFRTLYGASLGAQSAAIDNARQRMQLEQMQLQNNAQIEAQKTARLAAINDILSKGLQTGLDIYQTNKKQEIQSDQFKQQMDLQKQDREDVARREREAQQEKNAQYVTKSFADEIAQQAAQPMQQQIPIETPSIAPQLPQTVQPTQTPIEQKQPAIVPFKTQLEDAKVEVKNDLKNTATATKNLDTKIKEYRASLTPQQLADYEAKGGDNLMRASYVAELDARQKNQLEKAKFLASIDSEKAQEASHLATAQKAFAEMQQKQKENSLAALKKAANAIDKPDQLSPENINSLADNLLQMPSFQNLSKLEVLGELKTYVKDETFKRNSEKLELQQKNAQISEMQKRTASIETVEQKQENKQTEQDRDTLKMVYNNSMDNISANNRVIENLMQQFQTTFDDESKAKISAQIAAIKRENAILNANANGAVDVLQGVKKPTENLPIPIQGE